MHTSTVTQKGQIVIPAELRRKLGFAPGTKVVITAAGDGSVRVRPLGREYFDQFAGILSGEEAADALLNERRGEREAEEAQIEARSSGSNQ